VFSALRAVADVVLVGLGTAIAEHYHAPDRPDLRIYVIADRPAIDGNEALFESGRATLVLPVDAPPTPAGIPELRAGAAGAVDLDALVAHLAGKVAVLEGGPSLAGLMLSRGLVDEFFVTVSPRVVAGEAARIAHGPDADPSPWTLEHGFVDDDGYLFLRYGRRDAETRGRALR
jgi:riboflavin biosynthesis pyrimidine reductase